MFAVIKTGGKQYLVKQGDLLTTEKLPGEVGSDIIFDQVLLFASDDEAVLDIGKPVLSEKKVIAKIIEQGRGKKVTVIKFKPKVRYRRKRGHRQYFTKLQILSIL